MAAEEATLTPGAGGEAAGGGLDILDNYVPFADFNDEADFTSDASAEPPLPADDGLKADAEPQDSTTTGAVAGTGGAAAAGDAAQAGAAGAGQKPGTADPELSKEDSELVAKAPEAERAELTERLKKTASFWSHFRDKEKPIREVREHMRERDGERYAEFERDVIAERVADPEGFATELYNTNPEAYGRLLATADPAYFIAKATNRDGLTLDQVNEALSFHEKHRENEGSIPGVEALSEEEWEDLREWAPEVAEKLEAAKTVAAERAAATQPDPTQPKPGEPAKRDEPGPRTPEQIIEEFTAAKAKVDETWTQGVQPVETLVHSYADDKIGPAPTAAEFEKTPEVAQLRGDKRRLFLKGDGGDLPDFEDGFGKWGQHRQLDVDGAKVSFDDVVKRLGKFVRAGDVKGAQGAAAELRPFASRYADERLRHPAFTRYDALISRASAAADPKLPEGGFQNGAPSAGSQQQPADAETRFSRIAVEDALSAPNR